MLNLVNTGQSEGLPVLRHGIKSAKILIIASIYSICTFGFFLFTDPEPLGWKNLIISYSPMVDAAGCIFIYNHFFWKKYLLSNSNEKS